MELQKLLLLINVCFGIGAFISWSLYAFSSQDISLLVIAITCNSVQAICLIGQIIDYKFKF